MAPRPFARRTRNGDFPVLLSRKLGSRPGRPRRLSAFLGPGVRPRKATCAVNAGLEARWFNSTRAHQEKDHDKGDQAETSALPVNVNGSVGQRTDHPAFNWRDAGSNPAIPTTGCALNGRAPGSYPGPTGFDSLATHRSFKLLLSDNRIVVPRARGHPAPALSFQGCSTDGRRAVNSE